MQDHGEQKSPLIADPAWGTRLDGVDGLRGIAALSVMFGHVMILMPHPDAIALGVLPTVAGLLLHGLTLFFALSGFLLYRPFASAAINRKPRPSTREFLRNRVLRIWPAYVAILLITGVGLGLTAVRNVGTPNMCADPGDFGRLVDPVLLVSNLLLVQGWAPQSVMSGICVSWSLVPEVSFYLLLPLLGLIATVLMARVGHRPRWKIFSVMAPPLVLIVLGSGSRWLLDAIFGLPAAPLETWAHVADKSFFNRADLFGYGMLAASVVVLSKHERHRHIRAYRRSAWVVLGVTAVGAVLITSREWQIPAVAAFLAAGITLVQLPESGTVVRYVNGVLGWTPLRLAGLCSYSVYLWHFPVILFFVLHTSWAPFASVGSLAARIALVTTITLTLAAITYRWVELPFMRRKHRIGTG